MSVVGMLVFVSFSYMCMRCVRSNTRSRRASASPHRPDSSSSAAKVAHPHALTISRSAAEHNTCPPRLHGGSSSSSQNMSSPCRCTEAGRLHYLSEYHCIFVYLSQRMMNQENCSVIFCARFPHRSPWVFDATRQPSLAEGKKKKHISNTHGTSPASRSRQKPGPWQNLPAPCLRLLFSGP